MFWELRKVSYYEVEKLLSENSEKFHFHEVESV